MKPSKETLDAIYASCTWVEDGEAEAIYTAVIASKEVRELVEAALNMSEIVEIHSKHIVRAADRERLAKALQPFTKENNDA